MEKKLYENGIFEFINEEKIYTINGISKNNININIFKRNGVS